MIRNTLNPLVRGVASSKLVVSTLVFPEQKQLLCGIQMSGSVIQLSFSQGNMAVCLASLCQSRLLHVKGDGVGVKEITFIWGVAQGITSHLQFVLQGRQQVPV